MNNILFHHNKNLYSTPLYHTSNGGVKIELDAPFNIRLRGDNINELQSFLYSNNIDVLMIDKKVSWNKLNIVDYRNSTIEDIKYITLNSLTITQL